MYGTSYFPGGRDQAYAITEDDLYLVGTSEVALVSYHSNETFESKDVLPKMYCGYSSCFRREAGTYGKDTRGLYRVHQFTKIEQVIMCEADFEKQAKLHDFLLNNTSNLRFSPIFLHFPLFFRIFAQNLLKNKHFTLKQTILSIFYQTRIVSFLSFQTFSTLIQNR